MILQTTKTGRRRGRENLSSLTGKRGLEPLRLQFRAKRALPEGEGLEKVLL